jgi:hypothetical protein
MRTCALGPTGAEAPETIRPRLYARPRRSSRLPPWPTPRTERRRSLRPSTGARGRGKSGPASAKISLAPARSPALADVTARPTGSLSARAKRWRLRPVTNFPPSNPRFPPASVVQADWLSRIPALGVGPMPSALSPAAVERLVDAFERSVGAPLAEVGVDSLMMRQIAGQVAPGAAVFSDIKKRAHDFTKVCLGAPRRRSGGSNGSISSHSASVRSVV